MRWVAVVGVIVAIGWAFLGYRMLQDRTAALSRAAVPGQVTIQTDGPEQLTIFYEDPTASGGFVVRTGATSTLRSSPVDVTVADQEGRSVATAPYGRDLRFTDDGRVLTAVATVDAPAAGTYTVRADGDVPNGAAIAVGTVLDTGVLINGIGAVTLFVLCVLALVAVLIASLVERYRAS